MANPISIAFACDNGYAKHVAVVMQSIIVNSAPEDRHEFHVLTMGLTQESESRLLEIVTRGRATMHVHRLDVKRLTGFPETRHTLNTYLRLLLPEVLPEQEKIIYLDADLIVRGSLSQLWDFPIGNNAIAAAMDSMAILRGTTVEHFKTLQLPESHLYFNAGVLLLNLKVLREIQLIDILKEWATEHSNLMIHGDQDVLNVILVGKVAYFHLRWNLQVPLIDAVQFGWRYTPEQAEAVADPIILHYVTVRKPWRREFKLPYQNLYFQYLAQTPWQAEELQPLTFALGWQRCREELSWAYTWARSKARQSIGRTPVLLDMNRREEW
jgi:lipopolysaccharide biosynthesis glycosyltransferase